MRPILTAVQLERAVENAGCLFRTVELMRLDVFRYGDTPNLKPLYLGGLEFYCGYDALRWAEGMNRASAADALREQIEHKLILTRVHSAKHTKEKA